MTTDLRFSKAIQTLLTTILPDVQVNSIVAKTVNPNKSFIVYQRQTIAPQSSKDRITHSQSITYEFNCYARENSNAIDLAQILLDSLENQSLTTDDYYIDDVDFISCNEEYSDDYALFCQTVTLLFHVRKNVITN